MKSKLELLIEETEAAYLQAVDGGRQAEARGLKVHLDALVEAQQKILAAAYEFMKSS